MRFNPLSVATVAIAILSPFVQGQSKRPIERFDQLPVHSYAVSKAPSAMLHDERALAALAASVRADLEADLATYDIRDAATLRSYYRALGTIAMLQHRPEEALADENKAGALEEKPAARLLSGLTLRALIAAEKADAKAAAQVLSTAFAAELARIPYDSVQAELKTMRAGLERLSPSFQEGRTVNVIDPAARGGRISKELALQLLNISFSLQRVLPYRDEMLRQLTTLIDAHHVEKPDIWAARDVSLEDRPRLTPVVIAISDGGGVDPSAFPGRMWTNPGEIPGNGKDDDRNGYVDDAHGIGWTWDGDPKPGDLPAVDLPPAEFTRAKQNLKGFVDLQAGLDSPEARVVKKILATTSKDEVKPLVEGVLFYFQYAHGTHVTGIAIRGNPAARVLVARFEPPYRTVPPPPTAAWAAGFARAMERSVDYYCKAGVRVVNMSWGMSAPQLEHALDLNGIGASQQERHQLALQYFEKIKKTFGAAIAAAPQILFVSAAGNSNESNQFNESIPASYDLPNTITVGAVDGAGDEAPFTSFGKVDLYANGYEVESVLPGGDKQRWSGTSMAAPQVVNLAAKLFAAFPRLSAVDVKKLIVDGADLKEISSGRSIRLLNEARSFELAHAMQR